MSSQLVDLPLTSTVGGKLIVTIDLLNSNLSLYIGLTVAAFVIVICLMFFIYKYDNRKLKKELIELRKKYSNKNVRFEN
jgi:hypothetical protein